MGTKQTHYYFPGSSYWPMIGSIGLFTTMIGLVNWLHKNSSGPYLFLCGMLIVTYMLFGWFGTVIQENRHHLLNDPQVDRSFRWGMFWFIFTEVMFFATFFGALFYARIFSVPLLGGEDAGAATHLLLWPSFEMHWPLLQNPDASTFQGPHAVMETWGIPAINTLILLTSGATITIAHWGLLKDRRIQMIIAQILTIGLGILFLSMQAKEYGVAYTEKGLTLASGIYGTTFFMLTGFHAAHVTIGTIALSVILYRMFKGDLSRHNHFGFAAVSWYWHFVDVVWLILFIFVYWI